MAIPAELAFASLRDLGARLRAGEFSSVELTTFFLDRLERFGPKYNAIVTVTRDRALVEAAAADADRSAGRNLGPLQGIPFAVKDLLATKGIPTTWGAAPLRDQVFDHDATVVRKLRSAGAVLIGKLSMIELAGGFGYRQANASFTGPARNAWNITCWAGGSSSGPGSAVGAGLVPIAIGSETSGSIMTPAAANGITGLRPTYGRVSRQGAMALSWTLDKIGPMCRLADDCGLVLEAIAGPDPLDHTTLAQPFQYSARLPFGRKLRVGVIDRSLDRAEQSVAENFLAAKEVLGDIAEFEEVTLPELPYGDVLATVLYSEMAAAFEEFIRSGKVWELTAPEDRWGGHSTLAIPAKDYLRALQIRRVIQGALKGVFAKFDVLASPTLATVAGPVDRDFREWSRGFATSNLGVASNVAGLPGITLLNGFGGEHMPTGMQFIADAGNDNVLLGLGVAYQSRTEWHRRRPVVD